VKNINQAKKILGKDTLIKNVSLFCHGNKSSLLVGVFLCLFYFGEGNLWMI